MPLQCFTRGDPPDIYHRGTDSAKKNLAKPDSGPQVIKMTRERILKVVKTYILKGQVIKNTIPYLNLGEIPMRMWKYWGNLHFRFCKNGLEKRAALPWLSWNVLFWFWCLNSVLPQETFIMYLVKVTFSTNILWTFPELMETLNQPTFCKICKRFAEYIPL